MALRRTAWLALLVLAGTWLLLVVASRTAQAEVSTGRIVAQDPCVPFGTLPPPTAPTKICPHFGAATRPGIVLRPAQLTPLSGRISHSGSSAQSIPITPLDAATAGVLLALVSSLIVWRRWRRVANDRD